MPNVNPDPILSNVEAAAYIGCRPQTLAAARCTRVSAYSAIPFIKAGRRVGYRTSDLEAWLTASRVAIAEA